MIALPISHASPPMSATAVGQRAFSGEILLFSGLSAMRDLNARVRTIAREEFGVSHPPHAHRLFGRAEFLRRADAAQKRVDSEECKPLFARVLEQAGIDCADLFWDSLGLRIAPPVRSDEDIAKRGFRSHVFAHRDTWGAGFQAQINWWSPLWPLSSRRTFGFYPSYWRKPLLNTTKEWSFADYLASRKQATTGRAAAYPSAPRALAEPDEKSVPLLMRPGELLCFSSAHLHGSVANSTSLTRFSLEIRTLRLADLEKGRGAPNVDNESEPKPLRGLFKAVVGGTPLKERWPAQ